MAHNLKVPFQQPLELLKVLSWLRFGLEVRTADRSVSDYVATYHKGDNVCGEY